MNHPTARPVMPRSHQWIRRTMCAGGVLVTSVALAACGSSSPSTASRSPLTRATGRILNTSLVERAIARSALAQRGADAQVSCPSGIQQARGLVFSCTAVVGRTSTRFTVTELDGSGHVHYAAR